MPRRSFRPLVEIDRLVSKRVNDTHDSSLVKFLQQKFPCLRNEKETERRVYAIPRQGSTALFNYDRRLQLGTPNSRENYVF
jgi:hypothetical protein